MNVAEYKVKKAKRTMINDKNQEKEREDTEDEISFYDIMLGAIKFGLLPRCS